MIILLKLTFTYFSTFCFFKLTDAITIVTYTQNAQMTSRLGVCNTLFYPVMYSPGVRNSQDNVRFLFSNYTSIAPPTAVLMADRLDNIPEDFVQLLTFNYYIVYPVRQEIPDWGIQA